MKKAFCEKGDERGIALLVVLWAMILLMILAFPFAAAVRVEALSTLSFRQRCENRLLAEAGVERAVMEILYRGKNVGQTVILEGGETIRTDGTDYLHRTGSGTCRFRVTDESGRINLNALTDQSGIVLNSLLRQLGASEEAAAVIVDSILDWKDGDDLRRLNGAESDYYLSLPVPYRAKDANFDSLEELLLVRGVTQELVYGTRERKGLLAYLTLHSPTGGINVNAAPRDILLCIPEMTPELADAILEERKARRLSSADMTAIAGAALKAMEPFLSFEETNVYAIEAAGYGGDERRACIVAATVRVEGPGSFRYLRYKSPAERMLP